MKTKKELKSEYKSMTFRAGIFQLINKQNNRIYLQPTTDLERGFNSDLFQLKARMHSNKALQDDWNNFGSGNFEIKTFDELNVKEASTPAEINEELKILLEMHLTDLKRKGQLLY